MVGSKNPAKNNTLAGKELRVGTKIPPPLRTPFPLAAGSHEMRVLFLKIIPSWFSTVEDAKHPSPSSRTVSVSCTAQHLTKNGAQRRRGRRYPLPIFLFASRGRVKREDGGLARAVSARRVENGTGKSRPVRLHLPFKPTVNCFREKMEKWENGRERERERLGVFSRPFSRFPFSAGKSYTHP